MRIVLALLVLLASFSVSASEFDDVKELAQPDLPTVDSCSSQPDTKEACFK